MERESIETAVTLICNLFKSNKIPYCLTGGIAVSIWSTVRATEDIDIISMINKNDASYLEKLLSQSFTVISHKSILLDKTMTPIIRFVLIPDKQDMHYVCDIIPAESHFLKQVIARSVEIEYQATKINIIGLEDLIILKILSGRDQDILDAKNLLKEDLPKDLQYIYSTLNSLDVDVKKYSFL
ncbi:MAG: DUF6036 family nucleotidyltransferase [Spirochaetota bacterium]